MTRKRDAASPPIKPRRTAPRSKRGRPVLDVALTALVKAAVAALHDKQADDIVLLHIGPLSSLADVFVVAAGKNPRHLQALVDAVRENALALERRPVSVEGEGTGWVLIDFGDLVVHLFDGETREYYGLERLWYDAPRLDAQTVGLAAAS